MASLLKHVRQTFFYLYQNYCVFLVLHFLEANTFFHTLSHYIQNFLHIAFFFCTATRVFLVLSLTNDGIQEVKT